MKTLLLILLSTLVPQDEKAIKDKQADVLAFVKTAKTERDFRAATTDLSKLAEQAFEINKYELSTKLYSDAEKIARTNLKDVSLGQSFQEAGKKASDVGKEYIKASKAMSKILTNEATPEDYTTSGKFLCFVKGAWELGLSDLSKGKDEALKKLAEDDLSAGNPTALGDAWFALIKKESAAKERTLYWYAKAWPQTTGIDREKVRTKAIDLQRRSSSAKQSVPPPAPWHSSKSMLTGEFAHGGNQSVVVTEAPGNGSPVGIWTTPLPVVGQTTLNFRAWVLTNGGNGTNDLFAISLSDAAGKSTTPGQINIPIPSDAPFWTKIEQTLTLPKGTNSIVVGVQWYSTKGSLWLDDISVKNESGLELIQNVGFEDKK